jgi:hypothetical protein
MHWLLSDAETPRIVEEAGYDYDATAGYNEVLGYRVGTGQVYRPKGARRLLELPLHIQDGTLFFPQRLDLPTAKAWELCSAFIEHARTHGGVLTILWHDRSHGPERFWGDFYVGLLTRLKDLDAWFGTAGQVVEWFRARRSVTFERSPTFPGTERVVGRCDGPRPTRPFVLRVHHASVVKTLTESGSSQTDVPWSGENDVDLSDFMQALTVGRQSSTPSEQCVEGLVAQGMLGRVVQKTI